IWMIHTGHNLVEGNLVGTDVTGTQSLTAGGWGISISGGAGANVIGGTTPGARNLISGNYTQTIGVRILNANLEPTSTNTPNRSEGGVSSVVGGTALGAGNLTSGNRGYGIHVGVTTTHLGFNGALVQGNRIGTDVTGTQALGNNWGVFLDGSNFATVGGTAP